MYLRLDLVYTQGSQVPDGCLVFIAGTANIVKLFCWSPGTKKFQSVAFISLNIQLGVQEGIKHVNIATLLRGGPS